MTIFHIAQSFRKEGRRLVADPPHKLPSPEAAIATARRLGDRKAGAVAMTMNGDEETGEQEDPIVLFRHGQLPRELQGDDDDAG